MPNARKENTYHFADIPKTHTFFFLDKMSIFFSKSGF